MGYQRKVKEEVTITCDRCKRLIDHENERHHCIAAFHTDDLLAEPVKIYLCDHCRKDMDMYLNGV